jgi:hypothetical protein
MRTIIVALSLLASTAVEAAAPVSPSSVPDSAATVSLTQAELQVIIDAARAKAVADYITNEAGQKAAAAYQKVQAAFGGK